VTGLDKSIELEASMGLTAIKDTYRAVADAARFGGSCPWQSRRTA